MLGWRLRQYKSAYDDFVAKCSPELRLRIEAKVSILLLEGNRTKFPTSAPLGDGLFEVRAKHKNVQARLLYGFMAGQIVVVVMGAYKSSRTLPPADLARARELLAKAKSDVGALNVPQHAKLGSH